MKMKGISPLIAVITLIAFTLVVSGIFYSWILQFTQSQREEFQLCSRAEIMVRDAYYSPETGNINLVVYNTGRAPLSGFVVIVSSSGGKDPEVIRDFTGKEVASEGIGLFPVEYKDGMESMTVQSAECKNAQDMINIYDVEGL